MIYFCEDCGEKNHLLPAQLKQDKAVFRCSSCGYMNSYRIRTSEKPYLEKTKKIIRELKNFPEIIGSFFFHPKKGVSENHMPNTLQESDLHILGNLLTKNFQAASSLYTDVNAEVLVISDKNMIVKMIDKSLAVIIASKIYPLSESIMDRLSCLDLIYNANRKSS